MDIFATMYNLNTQLCWQAVARAAAATGPFASAQQALASLPANVFARAAPQQAGYTVFQRGATFFVKGLELGLVGAVCGFVGQATANTALFARQKIAAIVRRDAADQGEEAVEVGLLPLNFSAIITVTSLIRCQHQIALLLTECWAGWKTSCMMSLTSCAAHID